MTPSCGLNVRRPKEDAASQGRLGGEAKAADRQRAGQKAALAGNDRDAARRRGEAPIHQRQSLRPAERHRGEERRCAADHEHGVGERQAPPERGEQQQSSRRIGKRIVAMRIHSERDLLQMQRVGVVVDERLPIVREHAGNPEGVEVGEAVEGFPVMTALTQSTT